MFRVQLVQKMKETSIKVRIVYISFLLFGFFLLLDRILLPEILFGVPNELEWDTSPWFNFLEKRSKIRFDKEERGVLIAGSSVALYSSLPERMNDRFRNSTDLKDVRAEFYSHPALTPSDLYHYRKDIVDKNPSLLVFILNPADLQLDFLITPEEEAKRKEQFENRIVYKEKEILDLTKVEYDEKRLAETSAKTRHQNRMLYPFEYLTENFSSVLGVGKSAILSLLSRSIFFTVRYRSFLYDPFDAMIENHFRSGRSYHYFTGIQPKEGIYLRGWAKPEFHISCELKSGVLEESVFFQEKDTNLKVFQGEKTVFDRTFSKSGWQPLRLEFPEKPETVYLKFVMNRPISSDRVDSRIFGTEEIYGIRLSQNFCRREIRTGISYSRIRGLDDTRLASMDDSTYDQDYAARIYGSKPGASTSRLVTLRMGKLKLAAARDFFIWSELDYLKKNVEYFRSKGIRVLLVHSPENPVERSVYQESPWYKGYVSYLEKLGTEEYRFRNAAPSFEKKQDFLDPHHLTYDASERSTDLYADWISEILSEKK